MSLEDARGRRFGDMDVKNMNLQQAESMLDLVEQTLTRTLDPASQMIQDYVPAGPQSVRITTTRRNRMNIKLIVFGYEVAKITAEVDVTDALIPPVANNVFNKGIKTVSRAWTNAMVK